MMQNSYVFMELNVAKNIILNKLNDIALKEIQIILN